MAHVMLRFPEGNPLTREEMYARHRLCAAAQRQCDLGADIIVPPGVEIIVVQQGIAA